MTPLQMRVRLQLLTALGVSALLAACATPPSTKAFGASIWSGRMALSVDSKPPQRWQANFALMGNAQRGELHILSPLGNVLAQARWNEQIAVVERDGQLTSYGDSAEMTQALTGAEIPLGAMFAWLQGQDTPVAGWTLQRPSTRLLVAQRHMPSPQVSLRLVLNTAR